MAKSDKQDDPTIKSGSRSSDSSAPPSDQASDYAGDKQYVDNPDAEADAVAQLEVRPDEQ